MNAEEVKEFCVEIAKMNNSDGDPIQPPEQEKGIDPQQI